MRFTVPFGASALLALPLTVAFAQSEAATTQATPSAPVRVRLLQASEAPTAPTAPIAVMQDSTEQASSRGVIGVYLDPYLEVDRPGRPGALVGSLVPGGAAEAAGLEAGDRILAIDGEKLADTAALLESMKGRKVGDTVVLKIDRDGWRKRVEVTLGASENQSAPHVQWQELEEIEEELEADEMSEFSELIELHVKAMEEGGDGAYAERRIWINGEEVSPEELGIDAGGGSNGWFKVTQTGVSDDDCCEGSEECDDECTVECEFECEFDGEEGEGGFFSIFGGGGNDHGSSSEVRIFVQGPNGLQELDGDEFHAKLGGHAFGGAHGQTHGQHAPRGAHGSHAMPPHVMRGFGAGAGHGAPHGIDPQQIEVHVRERIERMHAEGQRGGQHMRAQRAPRTMRRVRVSAPPAGGQLDRRGRSREVELREVHERRAQAGHEEIEELHEILDELREELDDLRGELRRLRHDR
ncbi:MAG: hypothetical protein DRJ42_29705 [Deltaproteobacteria bacterium]|nr:MAG: hypothetical protein DRJ42_29705 [Deltaproteobacteria bacterium]